jgi:hypothetical protein
MPDHATPVARENVSVGQFADMALDVGVFLLASGAHCGRVFSNLKRLADRWVSPFTSIRRSPGSPSPCADRAGGHCLRAQVDNPPVVFTMPACITMTPGLYAYRSMPGGIKITDTGILHENPSLPAGIAHNIRLTFSLPATLAIGISFRVLLFRKRSVRDISLGWK